MMNNETLKKTRTGIAVGAATLLLLATSAAFAGEITGNGKVLKDEEGNLNGRSDCAFSGLQDDYEADEGFFTNMLVQNWGVIPKSFRDFLTSMHVHPGYSCNPSTYGE